MQQQHDVNTYRTKKSYYSRGEDKQKYVAHKDKCADEPDIAPSNMCQAQTGNQKRRRRMEQIGWRRTE